MRLTRRRDERAEVEDPVVRQYRFLLRTAPIDALEAAHVEVLPRLSAGDREGVLVGVQRGLSAGGRLGADQVDRLAHLVANGERRDPGAFLRACPSDVLQVLAAGVVGSEAVFGLFGGYAAWDGADPEPAGHEAWMDAGFNPDSGRWNIERGTGRDDSGLAGGSAGGWGGADGGGGGG